MLRTLRLVIANHVGQRATQQPHQHSIGTFPEAHSYGHRLLVNTSRCLSRESSWLPKAKLLRIASGIAWNNINKSCLSGFLRLVCRRFSDVGEPRPTLQSRVCRSHRMYLDVGQAPKWNTWAGFPCQSPHWPGQRAVGNGRRRRLTPLITGLVTD